MSKRLKPKPKLEVAKREPPKWQRERNISLLIWIIIPLTIALALGLVGYWGYDNYVATWHQPVAKVNKNIIDMDYFIKMLRVFAGGSWSTIDTTSFPYQVLYRLEDDELVRQEAPKLGIQVTPDEITETINSYLIPPTEDEGNVTPPETNPDEIYQQWLDQVRLSDSEYRAIVETDLLRKKLVQYLKEQNVPKETEQVHLHAILLDSEGNASELRELIETDEDFAILAKALSRDEQSKENGGDLGWVPRGIYPELDEVAFILPIGNVSEPISTTQGYYLIKVSEIDLNRPVEDEYREALADSEFTKWLQEQRKASLIEEYIDQEKITWAVDHV